MKSSELQNIMTEALMVGLVFVLTRVVVSSIVKEANIDVNEYLLSLLTALFAHVVLDASGLNATYCEFGEKCRKKS